MLKPCEEWNERISAYLDHECTQRECAEVERHLTDCAACRAAAELYRCDAQDTAATLAKRGAPEGFAENVLLAVKATAPEAPEEKAVTEKDIERAFSGEALAPKRRKVARWAEWLVVTGVFVVLAGMIFPVLSKARDRAYQPTCLNNQRQLVSCILMWAQDHENRLPDAENWITNLAIPPQSLICPAYSSRSVAYAYNSELSGSKLGSFPESTTIVTFDAVDGQPDYRHSDKMMVSYLDGHAAAVEKPEQDEHSRLPTRERVSYGADFRSVGTPQQASPAKSPTITPPDKNYGLADKLQIAYRANVALESADVQGAMEKAELLFRRYDGFVLTSNYQRGEEGKATATVSGRVPSGKLGEMLVEIDGLGTLTSRSVNGDDLTAAHLENLEKLSNLAGAQGNLERIGGGARKTGDALTVETRRGEAASTASGTRVEEYKLKSRVTLAEISITITSKPKPVVETPKRPVQDAFVGSLKALGAFGNWLAVVFVALLPWLLVLGIVLGPIYGAWYLRRRNKK